jgi:hypothetical protein
MEDRTKDGEERWMREVYMEKGESYTDPAIPFTLPSGNIQNRSRII